MCGLECAIIITDYECLGLETAKVAGGGERKTQNDVYGLRSE
jgi:hypothetical protein